MKLPAVVADTVTLSVLVGDVMVAFPLTDQDHAMMESCGTGEFAANCAEYTCPPVSSQMMESPAISKSGTGNTLTVPEQPLEDRPLASVRITV